MRDVAELRDVVLDLQRKLASVDIQAVRSCTSCLADSCNKPPEVVVAPASPTTATG